MSMKLITLGPEQGEEVSSGMGAQLLKVASEDTNGTLGIWESMILNGGPGPHIHHSFDEIYYILNGEVTFRLGERDFEAVGGSFLFIPRGTVHSFQVAGGDGARLLVMASPGGFEHFFERLASNGRESNVSMAELMKATGKEFDTEFIIP